MKRTRKKGNAALNRRIRKTTASLFMVLAIIVAVIPVGNVKTTQAANVRADVKSNLTSFYDGTTTNGNSTSYKTTDDTVTTRESGYSGSSVTLQRITSTSSEKSFIDFFEARMNTSKDEAMITKYLSANEQVSIGEKEYYDYVQVDGASGTYVTALLNMLNSGSRETYRITFGETTQTFSYPDTSAGLSDITIHTITPNTVTYHTDNLKTSGSLAGISNNKFVEFNSVDGQEYAKNIFEGSMAVDTDILTNARTDAGNYNTQASTMITSINSIASKAASAVSSDDATEWNRLRSSVTNNLQPSYTSAVEKTVTISDITKDVNSDGLPDIINYTICQRMKSADGKNLTAFSLERLYTEGGAPVYVPKLSGAKPSDTYLTDNNGYLAEGQVTVTGIAHDAFGRSAVNAITSVSVPRTVQFIGTDAFMDQNLESVTIDDTALKEIGDGVFAGCRSLNSVIFTSNSSVLDRIGNSAFCDTGAIESITIPRNVTQIGRACFADSKVKTLTFSNASSKEIELYPFSFFNCSDLTSVSFAADKTYIIGQGSFACGSGSNDNLASFTFPAKMKNNAIVQGGNEDNYDYILAGRASLAEVTLPQGLGSTNITNGNKVPDNTLAGCTNLGSLTFPEDSYAGTYDNEELFRDIMNTQFFVIGPKSGSSSSINATCREVTWEAGIDQDENTTDKEYHVPYQYTEGGTKYLEIGVQSADGSGLCIETIRVNADNTTAILTKYDCKDIPSQNIALPIPEKVGQYTITEIAADCVSEKLKSKIYKVSIADGTVKTIGSRAFESCSALQWVEIGNSVTSIQTQAFANCPKLENVVFSQNMISDYSALQIASDAFSTQSDMLTFHGVIHPDYAPYVIASNKNASTQNLTATGNEICYVTDAPLHLTVIKDNSTGDNSGKMTLIDYPHYEDVNAYNSEYIEKKEAANGLSGGSGADSYSITDRFELFNNIVNTITSYAGGDDLDSNEKNIITQVLHMVLPEGIESIDAEAFFAASRENVGSTKYFDRTYHDTGEKIETLSRKYSAGSNLYERRLNATIDSKFRDIDKVYSTIDTGVNGDEEVVPGLFSGYFYGNLSPSLLNDTTTPKTYNGHAYIEEVMQGNDHLTSIDLQSVTSLPDYAFDSNENLQTVSFSDQMTSIGKLPFRGCKALDTVNTNANTKYFFENWILYENLADGSLKIIECLEGRNTNINLNNDPNLSEVTELADGCFSNCEELSDVDLEPTKVVTIPENAFHGCDKLTIVKLPTTTQTIKNNAFGEITGDGSTTISIPNMNCTLTEGMCKDSTKKFNIQGIYYRDEINKLKSSCRDSFEDLQRAYANVEWVEYAQTFTVQFKLLDNTIIGDVLLVNKGADATPPTPPEIDGQKFSNWYTEINGVLYMDEDAYSSVSEDRTVFAVYINDDAVVVPDNNTYTLTMTNGTAALATSLSNKANSITAIGGTEIYLEYTSTTDTFISWTARGTSDSTDYASKINPITGSTALFIMPNANVTITANTTSNTGTGGTGTGGTGTGSGTDTTDTETKYTLTVNYGSGSGEYAAGTVVSISANAPESSTREFSKWTSTTTGAGFADATKSTTTVTMPASAVVVTANYRTKTSDDEDDSTTSHRRPTTGSTTTTTTTGTTANTQTSTTAANTNNNTTNTTNTSTNGDSLLINKNGVSNRDVGTANVDGSTDNFVVKITDSADATALIQQALMNKYGSLDGISYFPMDISLFDSTGNTKIEDTYGLNVTVTMPIPDSLIQYGGNAHVAAVDNGYIQDLTPRFTTIDGIGCISFVPPHFSPYVIYVDTNNLVAGQSLDATPQTGDPIHPKWFLATGMACLSILLFVTGDRKRKVKLA